MPVEVGDPAGDGTQRCLDDLGSLLALPGHWTAGDGSDIATSLAEMLPGMLALDLLYIRLSEAVAPVELGWRRPGWSPPDGLAEPRDLVARWLGDNPDDWVRPVRCPPDAGGLTLVPVRLGRLGELGLMVGGARRFDFPTQIDRLVLSIAATQATIGLQEVRRRIEAVESRRVEEVLRASEGHIRQILDTMPGLVHVMRADGEEERFNGQLLDFFGMTSEEIKDWERNGVVHPDDVHKLTDARKHSIPAGIPYEVEHRCRRADGVYRWFHSRSRPVRDPSGTITGWYSLMTEIDDLKRAEEELRRKEAFLEEAQRLSLTGSFSWHPETDEIVWSDQLHRIFELDQSEPVTFARIATRIHPDDLGAFGEAVAEARDTGDGFDLELRLLMPDRSVRHIHVLAHPARGRRGPLEYVGAVQDITERRASEEALTVAREQFARVARVTSLGALAASIAHEVNQPLSGIMTNAGTCLRMLAGDPPNVDGARETARRTIRDSQRASEVITRLRGLFTRKDAATEPVDLNEATREVVELSMAELKRARVVIRLELAAGLPAVSGDRIQLQQVVLNLITNAADAMGSVEDRVRDLVVTTGRAVADEGVMVSVRDSGAGLDPATAGRLFEAFYTTKASGMGIGLSVSRSIVERHGGRLWAAPNQGPGATFTFVIPERGEG